MTIGLQDFHQVQLFTEEECAAMATRVKELDEYLVDRRTFYTLGASTYLDDPYAYPAIANAFNSIIAANFQGAITRVTDTIKELKGKSVVYLKGTGLPSFHLFDKSANGLDGSVHVDQPYDRINWQQKVDSPFSFTVLVEAPVGGAGLNYWPTLTNDDLNAYEVDHAVPKPSYLPYELGMLYVHDGKVPHQIANPCLIKDGEHRISMQGHGVRLVDQDVIVIYF